MKKIFLLLFVFLSLTAFTQTTPSYKNVKLTQLPLGTKHDSVVLTNGSTKLLKYIPLSNILPPSENYSTIIYVNNVNPNSATIFDDETPPTVNDNSFKSNSSNLYIATNASTWVWNGSFYVTKASPRDISNFWISGTSLDAGANKSGAISRMGSIKSPKFITDGKTADDVVLGTGGTASWSSKANVNNPTFTGSVVVPNATLSTEAVNLGQLNSNTINIPQTYYVDTINGNDATAIVGNINRPYKNMDTVFTTIGGYSEPQTYNVIQLITNGTYYINGTMSQYGNILIKSDKKVIISFENNINSTILPFAAGGNVYRYYIPNGKIVMSSTIVQNINCDGLLEIVCDEFYENCSAGAGNAATFINGGNVMFTANKVTLTRTLFNASGVGSFYKCSNTILNRNNNIAIANINIREAILDFRGKITGTGGVLLGSTNGTVLVGDINLSQSILILPCCNLTANIIFNNSKLLGSSLILGGDAFGNGTLSGIIHPDSPGMNITYTVGTASVLFRNFKYDFKSTVFAPANANITIENSSIKSNGTLFSMTGSSNSNITLKNSTFEMTTPSTLITGGAGQTITVKIAGISTNATMISDQNGTGVTVTQFSDFAKLKSYTVATLPFGYQGDKAYVTDALAPTYMTTVVGGGAVVTPVFYNGTNWVAN